MSTRPDGEAIRVGALTRYRDARARLRLPGVLPAVRRRTAAHRPSADPKPRHHRRQPFACGPGVRTSGACGCDGGADEAQIVRRRAGSRSIGVFPGAAHHRSQRRMRCWSKSHFRSRSPAPARCFMEVARRRGDFALAGVAAIVILDGKGGARRCGSRCAASAKRRSMPAMALSSLIGQRLHRRGDRSGSPQRSRG